jgi:hypothetical protein
MKSLDEGKIAQQRIRTATAGIVAKKADTTMKHHETWNTSELGHLGPEQLAGKMQKRLARCSLRSDALGL